MSDPALYRIHDLEKEYNNRVVLSIQDLTISPGEILALVGPSGSGKSTFLRLLNFLEPPTRGWIEFHGGRFEPGKEMPLDLRREVTTVFQRPMLLNRKVSDNVSYGLRLRGQGNYAGLIGNVLKQVGMDSFANEKARLLSGGEAQRVSLARALILCPTVLLLDEPTSNLDPYNVGLIEQIIRQVNQEIGTTIIMVTHNVFQARRMANRIAFLLAGKLVEVSSSDTFFSSPRDQRTQAFINGEMVY